MPKYKYALSKVTYRGQFTKGKVYSIRETTPPRFSNYKDWVSVEQDDLGQPNGWEAENFVLLPTKKLTRLVKLFYL